VRASERARERQRASERENGERHGERGREAYIYIERERERERGRYSLSVRTQLPGTIPGDVVFVLAQEKHPKFIRKNDDLLYQVCTHYLSMDMIKKNTL
jgi:DnaJ-class molecular chaperone